MEAPSLKLAIVQGPREGEALDYPPGSTIRIGRVVRGNHLTIKDAGISSKHLIIWSESGKWTVQDLDSSNGTFLNSSKLPPFKPFDLHDGDTLKLGEYTSIIVHFSAHDQPSQVRRNPGRLVKRGQRTGVLKETEDKSEPEIEGVKLESQVRRNPRRLVNESNRGSFVDNRGRRAGVLKETEKSEPEIEDVIKLEESANIPEESSRTGRPRKARVLDKELENVGLVEPKRVNLRSNRGRKNGDSQNLDNPGVDCGKVVIESKRTRGDRRKRNNLQELPPENLEEGKQNVDLEKMTLGDWFDYMEVHLPKQIIEITEEMIEGMRKKAEQVREYMIKQKKGKGGVTVG